MIVYTDSLILGTKTGSTERGTWYNVSVMINDEPFQLSASKEAFELAKSCEFGTEKKMIAELRLYQGNWRLRALSFEDY